MGHRGHLFGGGEYLSAEGRRYVLSAIDLDAPTPDATLLPLSFLAHGISIDPRDGRHAALFEKHGPGGCLVDLARMELVTPITTPPHRSFYGHGVYSADGALVYATESIVANDLEGVLVVRDTTTWRELGVVPTHGTAPHDCHLVDDGKTMVVTNGGGPAGGSAPSVTYVELSSGRLLDRAEVADPRLNAGHLSVGADGALVVVSAPRAGLSPSQPQLGGVSVRRGDVLVRLQPPADVAARMVGETLSVVVDERRREILATQPLGHFVTRWGLDDGAYRGAIDVHNPRGLGVTLDHASYVVAHSTPTSVRVSLYSTATLARDALFVEPSFISGSHVAVHAMPAA